MRPEHVLASQVPKSPVVLQIWASAQFQAAADIQIRGKRSSARSFSSSSAVQGALETTPLGS